jgi:serine/threonine-protein kinase
MAVPLHQSFRFIHEPVNAKSPAQFVGRQLEIASLADRILFSEGGSFLVTGYRGVGKTSFVNQVIRKLEEEAPRAAPVLGATEVVDVYLNVARPMQPSEMMHHIIRRMNDRLIERGIYEHLDDDLREALKLAYDRTSVNMARKVAEASEHSFGVNDASIGGDLLKAAMKFSWSSKRSRTSNYETSYLGYDDKAAEHDVINLSRRLAAGYTRRTTRAARLWRKLRGQAAPRTRLKIIFVFDELDKLEEFTVPTGDDKTPGKPAIDEIIGSLKNLFTTSGVSFIFVAGKDLQERWLEDVGRGDSVYESVFAYDKYLPCLWADVGAICDAFVDRDAALASYPAQIFDAFKKYLAYRGRGIPRRIIRTFNQYVEWDSNQPSLRFASHDVRRMRFFAGLQAMVDEHEATLFGESLEEFSGTQSDKRRLGVYYLIDWILARGMVEFTLKDVLQASRRLSVKIALAEEIAPRVAEDILSVLVDAD